MKQTIFCDCKTDERLEQVKEVIQSLKNVKGALIPVLHKVQDLYGYLPEEVIEVVSAELSIPMAEIYGVATFYSYFSFAPKGEHVIKVCLGTACYVKGSQALLDKLSNELHVPANETTEDGKFTLEATRCLGACGLAPVLMIDDEVYGELVPSDIPRILKKYK